jgi:hypothetical protein
MAINAVGGRFLRPTVDERTLDVTSTGAAGIDWGNLENATTSNALTGTTVDLVANAVDSTALATGAITAAKFAAGAIDAAAIADGAIDANTFATGAITANAIASGAIDAEALAADAVAELRAVVSGTADSGSTTTMVDSARTEADTDYWKGNLLLFTSGNIAGQCRLITGFNASTDTITFAPATTQAVSTQTYEILPAGAVNVRQWLESTVNSLISGRVDVNVQAMANDVITAAAIANAAIDAATFAAGAIDATAIANGAIDAATFAAGAIDAAAIANGAIDAATFAAGAIDATAIADGAIDANTFAAGAITAAAIATDAIGSSELATSAANKIRDTILSDATAFAGANIDAAVSTRATPAQVNTEVLDVLTVDTFAQPGQEAPAATTSLMNMVRYLYKFMRNRVTVTSSTISVYADNGTTVDHKSSHTDDATTYDRPEYVSGP